MIHPQAPFRWSGGARWEILFSMRPDGLMEKLIPAPFVISGWANGFARCLSRWQVRSARRFRWLVRTGPIPRRRTAFCRTARSTRVRFSPGIFRQLRRVWLPLTGSSSFCRTPPNFPINGAIPSGLVPSVFHRAGAMRMVGFGFIRSAACSCTPAWRSQPRDCH